ncbi:MAG: YbgA family protein [Fibrobacterota bacterium]
MSENTHFPKPRIIISKCLGFAACRYNGENLHNKLVKTLAPFVEYVPVCPEVESGLPVPRDPIRVVEKDGARTLYQPAREADVSPGMQDFLQSYFNTLTAPEGFLLKNRSPSCGFKDVKIYQDFNPQARSTRGAGFFGTEVIARYPDHPVEDEGRLKNFTIREHYLTQIFTLARFREVARRESMKDLVAFHSKNKYLLMALDQKRMRTLGKITANHEDHPLQEVLSSYEKELLKALRNTPTPNQWINVIEHALGGFSDKLSDAERLFFVRTIEEYRDERIPLSVLIKLVETDAVRFEIDYLLNQSFLRPFPEELVEITDSGKGRNR